MPKKSHAKEKTLKVPVSVLGIDSNFESHKDALDWPLMSSSFFREFLEPPLSIPPDCDYAHNL